MYVFISLTKQKIMIYNYIVENVLLYVAETWTIQGTVFNKLSTVEMDLWRRSVCRSRLEKNRNTQIRKKYEKTIREVFGKT